MCLIAWMCVWFGISELLVEKGILVIFRTKYFGHLRSEGKLIILEGMMF